VRVERITPRPPGHVDSNTTRQQGERWLPAHAAAAKHCRCLPFANVQTMSQAGLDKSGARPLANLFPATTPSLASSTFATRGISLSARHAGSMILMPRRPITVSLRVRPTSPLLGPTGVF
jgi:hypothetical protein